MGRCCYARCAAAVALQLTCGSIPGRTGDGEEAEFTVAHVSASQGVCEMSKDSDYSADEEPRERPSRQTPAAVAEETGEWLSRQSPAAEAEETLEWLSRQSPATSPGREIRSERRGESEQPSPLPSRTWLEQQLKLSPTLAELAVERRAAQAKEMDARRAATEQGARGDAVPERHTNAAALARAHAAHAHPRTRAQPVPAARQCTRGSSLQSLSEESSVMAPGVMISPN